MRIVSDTMRTARPSPRFLLLLALAACVRQPTIVPYPEGARRGAESPSAMATEMSADGEYLRERHLRMPVAGADIFTVHDSFDDDRDGGRTHHAIDILAPRGTPVLAADDGRLLRLSTNPLGGITIYEVDSNGRMVYYYAHLDRYRDPLAVGMTVAKGDTIGYVGTTGNAPKDTPHLHFQIMRMPTDGKYWSGEPIDPWPVLRHAAGEQR